MMAACPPQQALAKPQQVFQWREVQTRVVCAPRQWCTVLQVQSGDLHAAVEGQDGGARLPGAGV